MPTLAEIVESPEAMQREADALVEFHARRVRPVWDEEHGVESEAEFVGMLERCGRGAPGDYRKLCRVGE